MFWNVNHLINKMGEIENSIAVCPGTPHIIIINETWLKEDDTKNCNILSYISYHNIRKDRRGGGVSIFIHETVTMNRSPIVLLNHVTSDLNHFLMIYIPDINIHIITSYRCPSSSINEYLRTLTELCLRNENSILIGDLNVNLLDQRLNYALRNTLEDNGFAILNTVQEEAITRPVSRSIIDIATTNILANNFKLSIIPNQASDHSILYLSMEHHQMNVNTETKYASKLDVFNAKRKIELWSNNLIEVIDGNMLNKAIEDIVKESTHVVTISSNLRSKKPYMNSEIVFAIRERNRLLVLHRLYPQNEIISKQLKEKKDFIRKNKREKRIQYEKQRFTQASLKPRSVWKLYNEILFNQTSQSEPSITINGELQTEAINDCNKINDYMCLTGERLATQIIATEGYTTYDINRLYDNFTNNNWNFEHVTAETVGEIINSIPNKKATSFDEIPISLIKLSSTTLAPLIANAINISIDSSTFPDELLKGRLKLIHKGGDNDVKNFRGLTIMPVNSKIYERTYADQLTKYLNDQNFFHPNQFGFRRRSSCYSAVLSVMNKIKSSISRNRYSDLKRAFDTIDPHRLCLKLRQAGLSESAVKLMNSYLTNRRTAVRIGSTRSRYIQVKVGIAQGSILGPLHFVIYMNDIFKLNLKGMLILYADDAVLVYDCESFCELEIYMQHDIELITAWLTRNVLTINSNKTVYMCFGRARHH